MPQQMQQHQGVRVVADVLQGAIDVATNMDYRKAAPAACQTMAKVCSVQKDITELDKSVQKLEASAPGSVKLTKNIAEALDLGVKEIDKMGGISALPAPLRDAANDLKKCASSFNKFTEDYKAYAETSAWNVFGSWSRGNAAKASWGEFQTDYNNFLRHVPAPLKDPALQQAASSVFSTLGKILNP